MHEPESKLLVLWRTTLEGGVEAKVDDQEKAKLCPIRDM
jgi:hypothetical protein